MSSTVKTGKSFFINIIGNIDSLVQTQFLYLVEPVLISPTLPASKDNGDRDEAVVAMADTSVTGVDSVVVMNDDGGGRDRGISG